MLFHRLCLIKKVLTTGLPPGIAEQMPYVSHNHNTRAHRQLQRPRARTNAGVRRLCFSGSGAYNRLPHDLHMLGLARFKTRLKELLLSGWMLIALNLMVYLDVYVCEMNVYFGQSFLYHLFYCHDLQT